MTNEECIALLDRYAEYNGMGIPNLAECREAMKMAAELLSQPSLPSSLDEAAQKVEDYYDVGEEHGYLYCHRGDIKDAFKVGAEWMAGQGETIEKHIFKDDRGVGILMYLDEKLYNQGDKVIVQIRKKQ